MKHFLTLVVLILPCLAFAQPVKHMFSVGGGMSYSRTKYPVYDPFVGGSDITSNSFSTSLKIGYFFIDRLCTGVYFPYTTSKSTLSGKDYTKSRSIGYGPFVKYYQPLTTDLYALAHIGYYWGRVKNTSPMNDYSYKDNGTFSEFGLGFSYLATSHVAVELIGSFSKNYQNNVFWQDDSYGNHFNLSLGLQVFIGKKAE